MKIILEISSKKSVMVNVCSFMNKENNNVIGEVYRDKSCSSDVLCR